MPRRILMLLVTLSLTACGGLSAPDGRSGVCAGLRPLSDAHAAALLEDGGDRSVVTGERLLAGVEAGCR